MELLVFGHAGAKVLMFPTREGRFFEYEQLGVVASLSEKVRAGQLQLFCIEGLAGETFYSHWRHPADRIRRHALFEDYVLEEVLPLMNARNPHDCTIVQGCSLGAFQAASLAFRHPHLFRKLVAFSGRYDLTLKVEHFDDLLGGYYDTDVYFRTPTHFLANLPAGPQLDHLPSRASASSLPPWACNADLGVSSPGRRMRCPASASVKRSVNLLSWRRRADSSVAKTSDGQRASSQPAIRIMSAGAFSIRIRAEATAWLFCARHC